MDIFCIFAILLYIAMTAYGQEKPFARVIGRHIMVEGLSAFKYDWTGVTVEGQFDIDGVSSIAFNMTGNHEHSHDLLVNGVLVKTFYINDGGITGFVNFPTPVNVKTVQLVKRTEALLGSSIFHGFVVITHNSDVITIPNIESDMSDRKYFMFFGDSLTCAYGNEGEPPCHNTYDNENGRLTWAALVARAFDHDHTIQCISGSGIVHNYGSKTSIDPHPLPYYSNRTLASSDAHFHNYQVDGQPTALLIYLGANDFSTLPQPTQQQYEDGYNHFLNTLRESIKPTSKLPVLLVYGWGTFVREHWAAGVENVREKWNQQHGDLMPVDTINIYNLKGANDGCDTHPSVAGQANVAETIIPKLKEML